MMAETGLVAIACAGTGGTGGIVVGMGPTAEGGGGGAAEGGGGVAAAGASAFGASAALGGPAPFRSVKSAFPPSTFPPSGTKSSRITPAAGEGTCTDVLSVSISHTTSSSATVSPTAFSHLTSPSVTDSANAGVLTVITSSLWATDVLKYWIWKTLERGSDFTLLFRVIEWLADRAAVARRASPLFPWRMADRERPKFLVRHREWDNMMAV